MCFLQTSDSKVFKHSFWKEIILIDAFNLLTLITDMFKLILQAHSVLGWSWHLCFLFTVFSFASFSIPFQFAEKRELVVFSIL